MVYEVNDAGFTINRPARLNLDTTQARLAHPDWAEGIPVEVLMKANEHWLDFRLYEGNRQIGLARMVSDYATFACFADLYLCPLDPYRTRGLSKSLLSAVLAHPNSQGFRRTSLMTRNGHGLYRHFGFAGLANIARCMEWVDPETYPRP